MTAAAFAAVVDFLFGCAAASSCPLLFIYFRATFAGTFGISLYASSCVLSLDVCLFVSLSVLL